MIRLLALTALTLLSGCLTEPARPDGCWVDVFISERSATHGGTWETWSRTEEPAVCCGYPHTGAPMRWEQGAGYYLVTWGAQDQFLRCACWAPWCAPETCP